MSNFIEMTLGEGKILIETSEADNSRATRSSRDGELFKKIDKSFDKIIQHQVLEQCKVLASTFEKMKEQKILPKKVSAEFGLQFNGEGNVYFAKVSSQASFKISFDWEF